MSTTATQLPSPQALASMVTNVTQTMFGIKFALDGGMPVGHPLTPRAAILPVPGPRHLTVAIAADDVACRTLAAAMFYCEPVAVDASMIGDALSEMANIVAGQIKSALALDQALGLPRHIEDATALMADESRWRCARLSRGDTQAVVWVAVTEQVI